LAREKSPYLLQHQFNPVDWFAWGEEAFAKARAENKPIFLSIGYSTCHWCHVMERESFESGEVADFLNAHFVSIKVDREERPDVDKIYMTFVQATAGQGGWPLTVFLMPDLKPFYGGTYFPPERRYGRASFLDVLRNIAQLWRERRSQLVESADGMHERLSQALDQAASATDKNAAILSTETLRRAGQVLKQNYDERNGGFGSAPKFPQPSHPQFLLRYATRFGDQEAIQMVLHTCERMASGGIHDQLGGGFCRYSVDAEWLVPHFEKMLYDNAQLAHLYLDAFLLSGDAAYAAVVRDILDYILRDMTHPEGGFCSAEDADSEGHEGKFYCWTTEELEKLLTSEEQQVTTEYYGLTPSGNFVDHSHPQPLPNQNVLSIVNPPQDARQSELLASAKAKMLDARSRRIRPHLDDKVLSSWNGLMLGAMARAGVVLGEERYAAAAERNLAFLRAKLWDGKTGTLYHRWRDGERDSVQLVHAYAFLLLGVIELYEATLSPGHLDFAIALADGLVTRFYDSENGGFWQSPADSRDLILRVKDDYDGAEPSGNSAAMLGLLKLGKITGREGLTAAAERSLSLYANRLRDLPQAVPFMLHALDFAVEEPLKVVIAGPQTAGQSTRLLQAVHQVYQPRKVVLSSMGPVEPFARSLPVSQEPLAYVCTGTACQAPTNDAGKVRELMRSGQASSKC
jgi:uncharacterized protein YyaL (SSP411 family)